MIKKFMVIIMVAVCAVVITGCGNNTETENTVETGQLCYDSEKAVCDTGSDDYEYENPEELQEAYELYREGKVSKEYIEALESNSRKNPWE